MNLGYRDPALFLRTLRCRLFGTADVRRWQDIANHEPLWDERSRLIATLIPRGSRVIDFGAGRRFLEAHLDSESTYVPADLVSRGPDTIVCDLNARPLPDLRALKLDVAVFAGVLEYVSDVPTLVDWLRQTVIRCVASYGCAQSEPRTLARLEDEFSRTCCGWVNSYSESELVGVFAAAGFGETSRAVWETPGGNETIFSFERRR